MSEFLKQLEREVADIVPAEAHVTKVALQASEVVIYTKNISMFLESESLVKGLAAKLKKRVHVRSDNSMLKAPDEAKALVASLIPKEAGVESISFDAEFNEVIIEAKKPGLVIGKHGSTLKEIAVKSGWYPRILRVPTAPSSVLSGVRYHLLKSNKERMKFLKKSGERIYRESPKPTDWVRLTPLGGSREVGRSCFLVETPESKVILDCGVNVASRDNAYPLFDSISFPLDEIDAIVISHGHLDHCGFLPYLYKYGYDGPTYCTLPTRDVMALLTLDYVDVTMKEGRDPPYAQKDIKQMIQHVIPRGYGEVTDISPDIRLTFHNAAHILGSASAHLHIGQGAHNLLYTSDFKFGYTKLFDTIYTKFPRIETLIMESTYGGPKDTQPPRYISDKQLIQSLQKTCQNGGSVLIPVFAIGRAQEIMLVIEEHAKRSGWDIPVYVDGMTKEASAIHTAYPEYLRRNVRKRILHNNSPFESDVFIEVDKKMRGDLADEKGSIFLSPSGMMSGGPSVEYFKQMCSNEKNAIVFVGYQGEGSLGRKIQNIGAREGGGPSRQIPMQIDGRTMGMDVKMRIETVEGFSGHSDRRQLLDFYKRLMPKPERVICVHGEERNCTDLARTLSYTHRVETTAPRNLDSIRLK